MQRGNNKHPDSNIKTDTLCLHQRGKKREETFHLSTLLAGVRIWWAINKHQRSRSQRKTTERASVCQFLSLFIHKQFL